jgi:plastocyanin domain-containing protein
MKATIISIILTALLIGWAVALSNGGSASDSVFPANNVSIIDGKQIIKIHAKGGYLPRRSIAKAGQPTLLRFDTNGTFDCSALVRIPSLNISQFLSLSGTTDIDIGSPQVATLYGTCGMGMYPFEIDFQS